MLISTGFSIYAQKERDNIKGRLQPEAERDVRISFLLDEIAKKEKIQVTEADVEAKIQRVAERFRRPVEEITGYYTGDESRMESLRIQIENEKTIQWIKDRANIKGRS